MDKIICVGKNYLKHAHELGDGVPEEPLYFIKPPSSACFAAGPAQSVALPGTGEVHHEVELVFKIGFASGRFCFTHYSVGLDLTLRELQSRLKKAGQPWEKAKVFRNSAVLGPWIELTGWDEVLNMPFALSVNGETRQKGFGKDMRWKPEELLQDIQRWFPLVAGDALFSGTPEGVGPLRGGDRLHVTGGGVDYRLVVE